MFGLDYFLLLNAIVVAWDWQGRSSSTCRCRCWTSRDAAAVIRLFRGFCRCSGFNSCCCCFCLNRGWYCFCSCCCWCNCTRNSILFRCGSSSCTCHTYDAISVIWGGVLIKLISWQTSTEPIRLFLLLTRRIWRTLVRGYIRLTCSHYLNKRIQVTWVSF